MKFQEIGKREGWSILGSLEEINIYQKCFKCTKTLDIGYFCRDHLKILCEKCDTKDICLPGRQIEHAHFKVIRWEVLKNDH